MYLTEIKRNYQKYEKKLFALLKSYYPNSPKLLKLFFLSLWKIFRLNFQKNTNTNLPKNLFYYQFIEKMDTLNLRRKII